MSHRPVDSLTFSSYLRVLQFRFLGFWSEQSIPGFRLGDYIALYGSLGIAQGLTVFLVSCCVLTGGNESDLDISS